MKILLVSVSYNDGKINICWSAENDVDNYELNVLGANGQVVHTQKTDSGTVSLQLLMNDYPFKIGGVYFVVVRYFLNNLPGNWSNPVELILNNPALPANMVTCEAGTVMAMVSNPNADAAVYTFQIQEKAALPPDNNLLFAEIMCPTKGLPLALTNQVEVGKMYQVRSRLWLQNAVTVWTDYSEITIIDVSKPDVTITYHDKIIHCSWKEIIGGEGYELECWTTGSIPVRVFQETITAAPYEVDIIDGVDEDQVYDIRLRAYQNFCYSTWDEKEVYTSSLSQVLKDLYDRLLAAYVATGNKSLVLDRMTLGDPAADVIALLNDELATDTIVLNNPVTITIHPELDQIVVNGVCLDSLLGIDVCSQTITFSTEASKTKILICMSIPTGSDWTFTQTFPSLSSTYIDSFTFDTSEEQLPAFVLCSVDQPESTLVAGLNFQGAINVTGALAALSDLITNVGTTVPVAGTIVRKGTSLSILLKGQVPDATLRFTGFQSLRFIEPTFVFYVRQDISHDYISIVRWVESDVTISAVSIPLAVKLPDAISGWSVMLTPGKSMSLGNVPGFLGFIVGLDLSALLPDAIKTLECFKLTEFNLAFDKDLTTFNSLVLTIDTAPSPTPLWTILPCLSFNQLSLQLQVYTKTNTSLAYRADILGIFNLTDSLALQARIILPVGTGEWVFSCYSTKPIDSLAAISSLMNGADLAIYLPQDLGSIGQFELSGLNITYNPGTNKLTRLGINIGSAAPWVLIKDQLIIQRIWLNLEMSNPFDSSRTVFGLIQGCLSIGQGRIEVTVRKQTIKNPWLFTTELLPGTMITIRDLASVAGIPEEEIDSFLPSKLPLLNSLALTQFYLEYNISATTLNNTSFSVSLTQPWIAIEDYVVLETAEVSMEIINNTQTELGLMAYISTEILLGNNGAGIIFEAEKKTAEDSWNFSGILIGNLEVNFNDLLNKINLSKSFVIPEEAWLPSVVFTELNANMTPEAALFHVDGMANIDWTIPFVDIKFPMKSLGGTVDIKHEDKEGEKPEDKKKANWFKAVIYGNIEFASINTLFTLRLGSCGVDHVFTAELLKSEVSEIDIPTLTNGFSDGTEDSLWGKITPNDFSTLSFKSAYLYYNQTKGDYFAYGGINNFGDAVLYSKNTGTETEPSKGYIFAFALTEGFKFSNLFTALAPIDEILIIKNAGIAIASYEVNSATELVQEINQIVEIGSKPGTVTNPIQQGNLPDGKVKKGVHLYSRLLLTGPLFAMFNQLSSNETSGLDVTLYAFFTTDTDPGKGSIKTLFRATFEPFDLINGLIRFKGIDGSSGIEMEYIQTESTQFNLTGVIGFNVFDKEYDFIGRLTVNNDQTHFNVTTTPATNVTIQLFPDSMPPLMVLKQLGLDVKYYFQTQKRTEKYLELNITGKVELVDTILFDSNLYLLDGKPILAEIRLTQDFSISQLIKNLVGNKQPWPTDFFDITFIADKPEQHSRLYFYDSSADTNPSKVNVEGNNFINGYNLESVIDLTFLFTIRILLQVNIETNKGMEAHIGLGNSIKIFILELASKEKATKGNKKYINGPTLNLNTKSGTSVFGFTTGFNFFEYPFGTADVTVGSKELAGGKTETRIKAKLTADVMVPIFGNLSVDFTYCQSEGFKVNNWPDFSQVYESVEKVIDIADKVSGIMKKADPTCICGALIDLIADKTYENKFNISPTFSTEGNEANGYSLYFVLNGTFEVYVLNQKVSKIDFPNTIKVPLPDGTSFDNLGGYIKDAIKETAESFVKSLVNNGEQWAQLAAILFAEQAVELGAQMLCEGLIDALTAEAMAAGAEAFILAGGIAAGGVAIVAGVAAASKTSKSCFTAGTEIRMADGTKKLIEDVQIGDKLLGYNNSENLVLGYDRPKLGNRKLYSINDGAYFFTSEHPFLSKDGWKSIDPEKTKKETPHLEVEKLSEGDVLLLSDGLSFVVEKINNCDADKNTQLYNFRLSGNNTYVANQLIAHNKGGGGGGGGGGGDKPAKPNIQRVEYDNKNDIVVTVWEKQQYANGYYYKLLKPDNNALDEKSMCYKEDNIKTSIKGLAIPAGTYVAKVCSVRDDYKSEWDEKTINKLDKTKNVRLIYDENSELLCIEWEKIIAPNGYQLTLLKDTDTIITESTDSNSYTTEQEKLTEGSYTARVLAKGDKNYIPGDSVISTNELVKPSSPVDMVITKNGDNIRVSWKQEVVPSEFDVILLKDGTKRQRVLCQNNFAEFDGDKLEEGVYTAKVRKTGNSTILPSNYTNDTGEIIKLRRPNTISFDYEENTDSLKVMWENVEGNNGYQISITEDNAITNIAWEGSVAKDVLTININTKDLTKYFSTYKAHVRTVGDIDNLESEYGNSEKAISQIAQPENATISYDKEAGAFICAWSKVGDACLYHIKIKHTYNPKSDIIYTHDSEAEMPAATIRFEEIGEITAGAFYLQAQAMGAIGIIPSIITESNDFITKLGTVLPNVGFKDNFINIDWKPVVNAATYEIKLYSQDQNVSNSYIAQTSPYEINVSEYDTGNYLITMVPKSIDEKIIDGDQSNPVGISITPLDINKLATQLKNSGSNVSDAAEKVHKAYPEANDVDFTKALATAGYNKEETVAGLKQEYPDLTPEEFIYAIHAAFDNQSPIEYTQEAKSEGKSVKETAAGLVKNYPELNATDFAIAIAQGGYSQTDVANALKQEFPELSPQEFVNVINAVLKNRNIRT